MNLSVLAIVGPTAVGKSDLAELLAAKLHGEIVSADSMQIYRGMDIGTAKIPPEDRSVPYHLIDIVEPGTPYSAALYQDAARRAVSNIHTRGSLPIFVGGTGLYIRAALDEMIFPPGESSTKIRLSLEQRALDLGPKALYEELRSQDPASAELIHPNNTKRVIRALEMLTSGTSYADQAAGFAQRAFHYPATLLIGLTMDRAQLYRRIDLRVDSMAEKGLLQEVTLLLDRGLRDALTASQAIGYKEIVPVIEGSSTLEDACAAIKQASRRYAKRQLSWFRADPRVHWLDVTNLSVTETASSVLDLVESCLTSPVGGFSCG